MLSSLAACSLHNQLPSVYPRRQPRSAVSEPSLGELSEHPVPLPCPPIPPHLWRRRSRCLRGQTDPEWAERVPERGRGLESSPLNSHSKLKPTLGYGLALVTRDNSWAYSSAFELSGLGPVPLQDTRQKVTPLDLGRLRYLFKNPSKTWQLCGVF